MKPLNEVLQQFGAKQLSSCELLIEDPHHAPGYVYSYTTPRFSTSGTYCDYGKTPGAIDWGQWVPVAMLNVVEIIHPS